MSDGGHEGHELLRSDEDKNDSIGNWDYKPKYKTYHPIFDKTN